MAGVPRPDKKAFAEVPLDFGRALRACMRCKLIKTSIQFEADGCENCTKLPMKDDKSVVSQCTTANFNGTISVFDPTDSWAAKWLRLDRCAPGCYALSVTDKIPARLLAKLEERD